MNTHSKKFLETSFADEARQVLLRVRSAFAQVVDSLPGDIRRPQELSKALHLDNKFAWKIMKVSHQADLFHLTRHVPGGPGVELFLKAASHRRVSGERVNAVRAAIDDLERFIAQHAGNRAMLEKMLLSFSEDGSPGLDVAQRKVAFEVNSYLWGAQARTQLFVDFFHPADDRGGLDICAIRGLIDLRRIRPGVPWTFSRVKTADDQARPIAAVEREPLDSSPPRDGLDPAVPLLREFSTKPTPAFRSIRGPDGFVEYELAPGDVGNTAGVTCLSGEVIRGALSCRHGPDNEWLGTGTQARTPCEAVVIDWFLHESLFGWIRPELAIYSELRGGPFVSPLEGRERDRLPCEESVAYLGKGTSVVPTPHVPNYAAMIEYAFDRTGWDPSEFDVYRAAIPYPVIPTTIIVKHRLPETPRG